MATTPVKLLKEINKIYIFYFTFRNGNFNFINTKLAITNLQAEIFNRNKITKIDEVEVAANFRDNITLYMCR